MATDEHTQRMRTFRDQIDMIERQREQHDRRCDEMRHYVEAQIEQERNDADPTGLRASAAALVDNKGQCAGLFGAFDAQPCYTFRVQVRSSNALPFTLEVRASSQEEAREQLIARVIAYWQGAA